MRWASRCRSRFSKTGVPCSSPAPRPHGSSRPESGSAPNWPAHSSATGRVLLAGLPDTQVDDYLRECHPQPRTPKTLTDVDAISERILTARESGVACTDEEIELGMLSIAVPVRTARGETVAAMSVSASTARTTLHDIREAAVPVLNKYAARLGRLL